MATASFTTAWLRGEETALAFLPRGYANPAARHAAVAAVANRAVHPAVLASLTATTSTQRANLEALARGDATCVVTGQQTGLFGGPLYTIYKAASAIANASALAEQTGTSCVPVFWLQNEDHDFEEIAACQVLDGNGALQTVRVESRPGDDNRSVAARTLGPAVVDALDAVEAAVRGLSNADPTIRLLRRCYTPSASPSGAFRALIEALFAPAGLLVVDPSDPSLAAAAQPVHERAFRSAQRISEVLLERSAALRKRGFAVPVHIRPGAPLSFFHPDGARGPRYRIEPDGDALRQVGADRTVSVETAADGPFSTSALLRPILQDSWLPTAAYVGGPGEIAYFAQLPPLYAEFGVPMPMIVPRARFRVVDDTARRLLGQLELDPNALAEPRDALLRRLGRAPPGRPSPDALRAALLEPVRAALADFAPHAHALDGGLARATAKTTASLTHTATRLVERYERALAHHDGVTLGRLDRLLTRLQPDGAPQERVHSWPWYAARYGVEAFVTRVLEAVVPFHGGLEDLAP